MLAVSSLELVVVENVYSGITDHASIRASYFLISKLLTWRRVTAAFGKSPVWSFTNTVNAFCGCPLPTPTAGSQYNLWGEPASSHFCYTPYPIATEPGNQGLENTHYRVQMCQDLK